MIPAATGTKSVASPVTLGSSRGSSGVDGWGNTMEVHSGTVDNKKRHSPVVDRVSKKENLNGSWNWRQKIAKNDLKNDKTPLKNDPEKSFHFYPSLGFVHSQWC